MDEYRMRLKSYGTASKGKTILSSKRKTETYLKVMFDGKDLTPKPLNPDVFSGGKERQISVYEHERPEARRSTLQSLNKSYSIVRFKNELKQGTQEETSTQPYRGSIQSSTQLTSLGANASLTEKEDIPAPGSQEDNAEISTGSGPAAGASPEEEDEDTASISGMKKIPVRVTLTLCETNTVFLLDIPSATAIKDTEEGDMVELDNETYEYLTVGKGRNRKMLHAEVQTKPIIVKTRTTDYQRNKTKAGSSYCSVWEMYDTYKDKQESEEESEDDSADSEVGEVTGHQLDEVSSLDSFRLSHEEKQVQKLMRSPRFLEAVCVIERLLASNCFKEEQKIFRCLTVPDDFREKIEYNYRLNHLWTFANEYTKGKSVNSLDWNSKNKDILAVGYGKFYFADQVAGMVLIWSIKNPVQPERQYNFTPPVTAVSFSKENPMLLAVGFYDGAVIVLNIASREKMIIGENVPPFEPCWSLCWNYGQTQGEEEVVCATFDDGKICAYSVQKKLEPFQLMRVAKADGKLKGYNAMKKCSNLVIPVTRYDAAYFLRYHPTHSSIYFVGTNQGVIHKCSVNYLNQHLDLFLAHEGPINAMKFSPFCPQIFATCGDDWHTRLWAEGISDPMVDMYVSMHSVEDFDWSPSHSTIFVTTQSKFIQIWDIQRKIYDPQSITESPSKARCTKVQFTDNGNCLIVGDVDGNVHVFSVEDLPFKAFFQENLLFESMSRVLSTNLPLMKKLRKLRRKQSSIK
nr:unnamed protein product [Callosobruchus analis]